MGLDILLEDERYLFVQKPPGMLSIPDRFDATLPSAAGLLRQRYGQVFIVHRIDRDTSGVLCFARDEETHRYTSGLFEQREVDKYYAGLVHGTPPEPAGVIDQSIMEHPSIKGKMTISRQGKPSRTGYEVAESYGLFSLLTFRLFTGRTHQIRVHCAWMGHPLVCDSLYGEGQPVYLSSFKRNFRLSLDAEQESPLMQRLALHAFRLVFNGPDGRHYDVEAPLPRDMNALLKQCRKWLR